MKGVPHSVSNFTSTSSCLFLQNSVSGFHAGERASCRSELRLVLCLLLTTLLFLVVNGVLPDPCFDSFLFCFFALVEDVVDLLSFPPYHCCRIHLSQSTLGNISVFDDRKWLVEGELFSDNSKYWSEFTLDHRV